MIEKGITIGGKSVNCPLAVIGRKEALDFVIELAHDQTAIGQREVREIHSLVMTGQANGDGRRYRTLDVKAAGSDHGYPSDLKVLELMEEFISWLA